VNLIPDFRRMLSRNESEPEDDSAIVPTSDTAVAAYVSGDEDADIRDALRRPIRIGGAVVAGTVLVMIVWSFLKISGAVLAMGIVKVENNTKDIRRIESGIVRDIFVHEGQLVQKGQPLIRFDDTQSQAMVSVYQSNVDSAHANMARFEAESANAGQISFPPELTKRASDPRVAALMTAQRTLFEARMLSYRSQLDVQQSQVQQLAAQLSGLQIQAQATDEQTSLVQQELRDVRELSRQGYAPESRLLSLERSAVDIKGQRGQMTQNMARAREAIGQARLNIAQVREKHQSDAADGIRAMQEQLAENTPKLEAALAQVAQTEIYAPATGYVFNLTPFPEGGGAVQGQLLMQLVPANAKMVVTSEVEPRDIADVKLGMPARVTLTAYNTRTTPPVDGRVTLVAPDAKINDKTGQAHFAVEVTVTPEDLAKAGPEVKLKPGMQAQVAIVTGSRSIMGYLLQPFSSAMHESLREK
jgi:HlyD family type I secretion membrane fusion protein